MNQIEIWNGIVTRKLIRRGTYTSVRMLNTDIEAFVKNWNANCVPFKWTATAEEIIGKVRAITSHMARLMDATNIEDVANLAA